MNVLIASYEQIRMDSLIVSSEAHFDVVVLDEAQRIKNSNSDASLACRLLERDNSWALTGTPIENVKEDLVSIYRFIKPGLLRPSMSRTQMHMCMKPFFLRRRKKDVLPELPPIIVQDVPLDLDLPQREAYDRVWLSRYQKARAGKHGYSNTALFALLTQLKQLCNFEPKSGASSKLEALELIVDGLHSSEDKMIVFSQYVKTLQWLSIRLTAKVPHEIFHGGLNEDNKNAVIARFKSESGPRILLMSLKAGGIGLNLQEASTLVLFDRWWNPAVEAQAIHRAHRFGREKVLHVLRFLVVNSIEERIAELLKEKQVLFEEYIDLAESASLPTLSRDDLLRILELSEHSQNDA
jgi:SNF2 family DNA or RNA helicase